MNDMTLDEIKAVLERANDDVDRVSPHEYREVLNAAYSAIINILDHVDDDVGRDDDVYGILTDLQKELLEKLKIAEEWDIRQWRSSFSRGWDR